MDLDLLNNPRLFYTFQRDIVKEMLRHEIIATEIERWLLKQLHTRYHGYPFPRNLGLVFGHDDCVGEFANIEAKNKIKFIRI
ncbi:hypothetical protein WN944_018655 [Citrus x changshan-huyou]|uniref:Uncharacterized protein n=1 Tax=Citrus x changshan-huyou TaxID=2935761 RepID=A0AAP0QF17_9ROSI